MPQPEGKEITDKQLKFSYWYLSYKKNLRRGLIILLLVCNAVIYFRVFYPIVSYLAFLPAAEAWPKQMIEQSVNWSKARTTIAPKNIVITESKVVPSGPGVYDVITWVKNPNEKWYARSIDYTVVFAGQKSKVANTFLLPGEERVILTKDFHTTDPTAAEKETSKIQFENPDWQMLDNPENYLLPKFQTNNIMLEDLSDQYTKHRVTGELKNLSLFGFRTLNIIVIISQGSKPVAVSTTTIQNIELHETRPIDIRFTQDLSTATNIDLFVITDNLDKSNLIPS